MCVYVDEAGTHDLARSVDDGRGLTLDATDLHDAAVFDADIGAEAVGTGSVDDLAVADDDVEHVRPPENNCFRSLPSPLR